MSCTRSNKIASKGVGVPHLGVPGRSAWPKTVEGVLTFDIIYTTPQDRTTVVLVGIPANVWRRPLGQSLGTNEVPIYNTHSWALNCSPQDQGYVIQTLRSRTKRGLRPWLKHDTVSYVSFPYRCINYVYTAYPYELNLSMGLSNSLQFRMSTLCKMKRTRTGHLQWHGERIPLYSYSFRGFASACN